MTFSASFGAFCRLSAALIGEAVVPDERARGHYERAMVEWRDSLTALLLKFDAARAAGKDDVAVVREDLLPNAEVGATAKNLLLLWYTGGIQNAAGDWQISTADQYYFALVWEAIGAHAPALSNGYYGHWKYPPER